MHTSGILRCHPWRKMGTGAVRLHDDQIRLTAKAIDADYIDALTRSRMEGIVDDHLIYMIMGSMLPVRLAQGSRTLPKPSRIRRFCKATRYSISKPTTSLTVMR